MKPSRPHRFVALTVASAAALSACSAFRPPSDVNLKAVPIDLTFGAKIETGEEATSNLPGEIPPAEIILPTPPKRPPLELAPVEICPLPPGGIPASARDVAEPTVAKEPQRDPNTWLFTFSGQYKGEQPRSRVAYKRIRQVNQNPSGKGFNFVVDDDFTGATFWFAVLPQAPGEIDSAEDGLFIKQIHLPLAKKRKKVAEFIPANPDEQDPTNPAAAQHGLKMLEFPIEPGATITESGPDTAAKEKTGVNDPLGLAEFRPAANTITSTVDVGVRDIIDVCDEAAQAWRINWTIEVEGEWDWTMIGTFWIATQYGGLPIKEDYILFGDGKVIEGTFASNLMRLDPGRYL